MTRFVSVALIAAMGSSPAWAQSAGLSASNGNAGSNPSSSTYHVVDSANLPPVNRNESRIIAGTELAPNAIVGFGMFGFKSERSLHSPVTARDLATTRQRKAAVGFSLKF